MIKIYSVYVHTTPNGKKYIGYTGNNVKRRWGNGKHYKQHKHFYNAIQKYGWENITHEIVFQTDNKQYALEKEMEYIKLYKSNNRKFGYNNSIGGESGFNGGKHSYRTIQRLKNNSKIADLTRERMSKPVAQYDLTGNFIMFYKSISEASLLSGITRGTIERGCKNKLTKPNKYFWEYCDINNVKDKIDVKKKTKPRKDNRFFTFNGKTQTAKEWAKEYNINYLTLLQRLTRSKKTIQESLTSPIDTSKITKHKKNKGE